jgi:ABC-type sugar transport system ATPase subunit
MPEVTVQPPSGLPAPACSVRELRKTYGAVQALRGVSLDFAPGQVHAVLGENGAGKSTLMKILAGAETPDEGSLMLAGKPVEFSSVKNANSAGIAIVFQELSLFPELDVLANLFVLKEPRKFGLVQKRKMRQVALPILQTLGLSVNLDTPVGQFGLHDQQLLEIAKALINRARVVILDEPTSSLNADEVKRLFEIVRTLRDEGVAVLFISHRLEEVFAISERITVLRDGAVVSSKATTDTDMRQVVREMIGRTPAEIKPRARPPERSSALLRVDGLAVGRLLKDVNFVAGSGEVIGLAGLDGAGQVTVLETIFGIHRPTAGSIHLPNQKAGVRSIRRAIEAGVAMVPADRRVEGLMLNQDLTANIAHVVAGALGRRGFFLRRQELRARALQQVDAIGITAASVDISVSALSGGNQQKVLLGRWLEADPDVLLLNDPTRGVDVGAKAEIYAIVRELADRGKIVLLVSTEEQEYQYLCDRVVIFHRGASIGELTGAEIGEHAILTAINTGSVEADQGAFPT